MEKKRISITLEAGDWTRLMGALRTRETEWRLEYTQRVQTEEGPIQIELARSIANDYNRIRKEIRKQYDEA